MELDHYLIIRRNGDVVLLSHKKIATAVTRAFLAVRGPQGSASVSMRDIVEALTNTVVHALLRSPPEGETFHIKDVQAHVELTLMRGGHQDVASRLCALPRGPQLGTYCRQAKGYGRSFCVCTTGNIDGAVA